jgi:Sec-independent protein translocase protein TatA
MRNKKASLNLSIQAIVIVVIAFVVLGLGLGFVKNTFKDIGGTTKEVQSKIKEQILEDLRTSGKKLSLTTQIQLERGSQVVENIGVVNTGLSERSFGIQIEFIKKQNPDGSTDVSEEASSEIVFFYSDIVDKRLSPTAGDVFPLTISAKSSAAGNYLFKVNVQVEDSDGACLGGTENAGCELYDTRSFFVRVS